MNTMSLAELEWAQRTEEEHILTCEMTMMDYHDNTPPQVLLKKMADKAQVRVDMLGNKVSKLITTSNDS